MDSKLYVGNLNYDLADADLMDFFAAAGEVTEAVVIKDRYTGRSKGFGFVTYANAQDADKAVEMFDGKDFQGRNMVVNKARPKKEE